MRKSAISHVSRLRRLKRQLLLFVNQVGHLSFPQVFLFLIAPLAILVYLSFSPFPQQRPHSLPLPMSLVIPASNLPQSKNIPPPAVTAQHVFILDQNSKIVLWQKNASDQIYPASTTKMMTALVALENYPLSANLTITRSYPEGQNIDLIPGEVLTVEQLLYALLIQSANDAAEVLAENFPGGRPAFVTAMNIKAGQLHLTSTRFLNPTGLDEDGHYSSALDLVRLADVALRHPEFAKIVAIENSIITTSSTHILTNINQLLGKTPGVKGVKSGQTDKSGQSLVTLVDRDNHPILLALLGSTDRFGDTQSLIDWIYSNHYWVGPDTLDQPR